MASLEDLERRVAALEGRFPRTLGGAQPNSLQVGQVGISPTSASAMFINLLGNVAGSAPRINVNDPSGVIRAEMGNLAANGTSPAMWGFRANKADGTPIFDSEGLIAVMSVLGSSAGVNGTGTNFSGVATPSAPFGSAGGTQSIYSVGFTLSRQITVKIEAEVTGFINNSGGIMVTPDWFYIQITGQSYSPQLGSITAGQPSGTVQSAVMGQVISLAAGTYTANIYWNSTNGTADTLTVYAHSLYVFQLGS